MDLSRVYLATELCVLVLQAAELAEFTAKISLLEEAKRKKEEEANEWQHKVVHRASLQTLRTVTLVCIYRYFIVERTSSFESLAW